MTKREEVVFDKAFAKMEAKGYFTEIRARAKNKAKAKAKAKPMALKTVKKPRQQAVADSISSSRSAMNVPLAANKR
jgi:hypothetical protein